MNRDDRLFAIIGGTVVTAAAIFFLVSAGAVTGGIGERAAVRVAPNPVVETPPPAGVVEAALPVAEPVAGDPLVRELARRISAHPEWAAWLVTDDLVERFVSAVEAVADGYSPRDELDFVRTDRPFLVREDGDRLVIAAGTFRRFDAAVEVFCSLDADAVVALYRELEPTIHEVRRDVAWHRGEFSDRMRQAVDHLLAVDVPSGVIEVERRTLSYVYADDDYERLSDAQRLLLRMGQGNASAVQSKLREIRDAFGWPAAPEPPVVQAVIDGPGTDAADPVVVADGSAVSPETTPIEAVPVVAAATLATPAPSPVVAPPVAPLSLGPAPPPE